MPTRWIEQAESRRVLTVLLSERLSAPPRSGIAEDATASLPARLLSWLAARQPAGWPVLLMRSH
jgi:hypothetical protein